uniref:Uncharacterized protein n=1 Tax=Tanacetum cinerariifolium TaxID=118510 RepID=A0A6L2N278_TANCI|nr:hypothetical protein [Tanacetum cinerariifolium]
MTNKKKLNNVSNKRNVKLRIRYNDHVMSNLSQKRANTEPTKNSDEIKVRNKDNHDVSNELKVDKLGEVVVDDCDLNDRFDNNIGNEDFNKLVDTGTEAIVSDKESLDEGVKENNEDEVGTEIIIRLVEVTTDGENPMSQS